MHAEPGLTLSHYRLIEEIGKGGMGVVWKAEDTVLNRTVALKLLPDDALQDTGRLTRFRHEARFLASLNHPNIAAIHGLEEAEGARFLVLEYVPGTSLAERLRKGPLSVEETLKICGEIARALESAHDRGVIHRDLKPGNVQLTSEGRVKVLDFGLAKAFHPSSSASEDSQHSTLTMATHEHTIVGTTPYMSPEQASAKPLDKRTDIWSFGCILYELLAGRRAFPGDTTSSVIATIHGRDPDWDLLPKNTPVKVHDLLRRCLAKDPDQRLHDIADARIEIEEALSFPEPKPSTAPSRASFLRGVAWTVAGLVLIGAIVLGIRIATRDESHPGPSPRLELTPNDVALTHWFLGVAVSPDGTQVAFCGLPGESSGDSRLYLRSIDELDARPLVDDGCWEPFFSPDGRWVGYQSWDQKVMKVPITGGKPLPICDAVISLRGASWGEDGTIIYSTQGGGLFRVSSDGGVPELLVDPSEAILYWPQHLPGSRTALVTVHSSFRESRRRIAVVSLDTREIQDLLTGGTYARYATSGHLVYSRLGTLYGVRFDPNRLKVIGTPVPVVDEVSYRYGPGAVAFAISESGSLVYALGAPKLHEAELVHIDRRGQIEPLSETRGTYDETGLLSFSPDGTRLAVTRRYDMERYDVWVYSLQRGSWTRLTFDEGASNPVWSPDGKWVVFYSEQDGSYDIFRIRSDGTGEPEQLTTGRYHEYPCSFSPDGGMLAYWITSGNSGSHDVMLLPLDGDRTPQPFLATSRYENSPVFSPDGHWLAYCAGELADFQVWVRPYPGPGPKVEVSAGFGMFPVWGPDGSELFYSMGTSIWRVAVDTENGFRAGSPERLVEAWPNDDYFGKPFQISPDGEWFAAVRHLGREEESPRLVFAVNWTTELARKVAEAQ